METWLRSSARARASAFPAPLVAVASLLLLLLLLLLLACGEPPPTYDQLSPVGALQTARADHSAVLLLDGRVLIAGGGYRGLELYDPKRREFEAFPLDRPNDELPEHLQSLTPLSEEVVIITGLFDSYFYYGGIKVLFVDDGHLEWLHDEGEPMVLGRRRHEALKLDATSVLFTCGSDPMLRPSVGEDLVPCNMHHFEFLGIGDASELRCLGGLPSGLYDEGCAALLLDDHRVLLAGGLEGNEEDASAVDFVEVYDLETESYRAIGPMAAPRGPASESVLLPDGRVLLVGDSDTPVELLDIADERFASPASDGELPRFSHARASLLADGRVLITGGQDADASPRADVLLFDPDTNALERLSLSLTPARYDHASVRLEDGRVLLSGGLTRQSTGEEYLADAQLFE